MLADWLGHPLTAPCGADEDSQTRYRDSLVAAGYEMDFRVVEHRGELTIDQMVGGVYSALSEESLPAAGERAAFADRIRVAVEPHSPYVEPVPVRILTGRC
ncbi:hypothetical protein [Amycolatopsis jiangsuensis]|uniref:Uncharacterized protein n=1 Tax=Amycolatopsis jiangsuensis TaxID=1181879 RepID=A0A840IXD5_9PSEU|nr:hypothetical protein [Amycolatopsis jiangsuensis]MBB4685554.1 hypothetical protein [Amycolatopsis jiangsuensis]